MDIIRAAFVGGCAFALAFLPIILLIAGTTYFMGNCH